MFYNSFNWENLFQYIKIHALKLNKILRMNGLFWKSNETNAFFVINLIVL
jgi:hypothetical protein